VFVEMSGITERERERVGSLFLTAHQHKTGHSVPFEVKIKAIWIIRKTKGKT